MPPTIDEILNVCQVLSETENLHVTIVESFKGALLVAASSFAGGLLGGSRGLLLGGVLGSVSAAVMASGKYKSVIEIIANDMNNEQKQRLAVSVQTALSGFQIEDVAALSAIALGNDTAKQAIIHTIGNFFQTEMGMTVLRT